ncbi:MAG: hypothetical protein ACJ78Q_20345 [Chloroflexia bacterium]
MSANAEKEYEAVASEIVSSTPSSKGKMFGMPVLKNEYGKAFAGYTGTGMVFKLSGPSHGEALGLAGAKLFDPMGGRPMKEWVDVPVEHVEKWPALARAALEYTSLQKAK